MKPRFVIRNTFAVVVVAMLLALLSGQTPTTAAYSRLGLNIHQAQSSNSVYATLDEEVFAPDGWQELITTKYNYTLWYPPLAEAKLYEPESIVRVKLDDDTFSVQASDDEDLSIEEWLKRKYKEQLLPTPTEPKKILVGEQVGYSYSSFAGDHWNHHIIIAQDSRIYEIFFPEGGVNEQVFLQMLSTFQVRVPGNVVDTGFELINFNSGRASLSEVIPDLDVPLLSQEDGTWGGDQLGTCATTIARAGCAITSLAMISNYYQSGFTNPRQINSCLRNTGGYADGCNVYWSNRCMPSGVSYAGTGDIDNELRNHRPVVVAIDGGNHWVVVIGKRSDGRYTINNPSSYSTSSLGTSVLDPGRISDTRLYNGFIPNQPPNKPSLSIPPDGSTLSSSSIKLEWQDNGDPDNQPRTYRDYFVEVYRDGTKVTESNWITGTSWTVTNLSIGNYEWRIKSGDGVASSDWSDWWDFTVDTVAPTGSVTLNYGWQIANSVSVPLDLTASDQHSGVQDVRVGATCSNLGVWQPLQSRLWWQLTGQHGSTAHVCVQFRDRAGNTSQTIERSIRLNFYPAQQVSANYRLRSDVVGISGQSHQSSSYRLDSTAGQTLASGSYAKSSNYRATLGFWPRVYSGQSGHAPSDSSVYIPFLKR
ncbi:MAG: hypothetical protein HGA19_01865 [Oscillochloris sp.]|nr:hypothetical protein [Oscillochloris sp.]